MQNLMQFYLVLMPFYFTSNTTQCQNKTREQNALTQCSVTMSRYNEIFHPNVVEAQINGNFLLKNIFNIW